MSKNSKNKLDETDLQEKEIDETSLENELTDLSEDEFEEEFSNLSEEEKNSLTGGMLTDKTVYINGGELYVVATPIGRIVDLTVRAARVLEAVDLIAAEDSRRAYILLNILGIRKKVVSNQKFNEIQRADYFINELKSGKSVAVISDAGTPCISDPGNELIIRALEEGIKVVPVPGACAAVTGLSASGFDLRNFMFCGFFPKKNSEKKDELKRLQSGQCRTYVYYESPKRVIDTVKFFADEKVGCRICLCNDLTKNHERFYRGTPAEVLDELHSNENAEKGEYALIVEIDPSYFLGENEHDYSPEALLVEEIISKGITIKEAINNVLESPFHQYQKNELKAAGIKLKNMFS